MPRPGIVAIDRQHRFIPQLQDQLAQDGAHHGVIFSD
jgi:hypothetical protein